jgi:exodeoxyribonuclease V alpha subunit
MSTSPSTSPISKDRLAQLLANMRAKKAEALAVAAPTVEPSGPTPEHSEALGDSAYQLDKHGQIIHYNTKQQEFVTLAGSGADAILIGAAGTGKTTCMKGTVQALIQNGIVGLLQAAGHKHLLDGTPGLVICAYTRRAVNNIRKNLSTDVQANCITIHKLLEYQPVYYEVSDPMTGDTKTKMNFEPTRNQMNPLPSSIRTIIFEESSMIGTDLYKEVINACPHNPQLIFLGDIQQLSPVFGPAILGFKLLSLPVVELTEVYRQALESPIISLAHRILSGSVIPLSEFSDWKFPSQLTIHPWKKKITPDLALNTAGQFFIAAQKSGAYNPEEDMILLPFNKSFGTIELNKIIANQLAKNRESLVYEVVSGFMKHYFSIGDKVLFDKEDAVIINIEANPAYTGAKALPASTTLDYWGYDPVVHETDQSSDIDMDFLLSQVASSSDADRVHQASHTITLRMLDSEVEIKVDKASSLNAMLLGYALTVHKSQGSEWAKVFCVFHQSHATMIQRELLYTAITRAKKELYIICEPETFVNGINSQKIKGETIAEKAEFFKGKVTEGVDYE